MLAVAGTWELGWNTPILERDIWEYMLRDFGVDRWWMAPVSGIFVGESILSEVAELPEVIESFDGQVVFVDERGNHCLNDDCEAHWRFEHPEDVLYVLGRASFSPMQAFRRPQDQTLVIHTPEQKAMLWPHQAIAIVLHDRSQRGRHRH